MVCFAFRFLFFSLTTVLIGGFTASAGEPPTLRDLDEPMPQVLYSSNSSHSYATWVSASAALDPSGQFDESLFHPYVIDDLKYQLSKPTDQDGCIQYGAVFRDLVGAPNWGTPEKVLTNSDLVIQGTIVGQEYGFKGSVPGQLLKLRADKVFKGPLEHLDSYFVFFPVGEFQVGDVRICKTDPRYPPPPGLGNELVVSVPHRNNPDEQLLRADGYGGQGYITIKNDKAHWSPALRNADQEPSTTNRAELLTLMSHVLKEGS